MLLQRLQEGGDGDDAVPEANDAPGVLDFLLCGLSGAAAPDPAGRAVVAARVLAPIAAGGGAERRLVDALLADSCAVAALTTPDAMRLLRLICLTHLTTGAAGAAGGANALRLHVLVLDACRDLP
eukprot:gene33764-44_t